MTVQSILDLSPSRYQQFCRILFGLGMIGLGALAFVDGQRGLVWYSVPGWVPWQEVATYASGVILLSSGVGLLLDRTAQLFTRLLLAYLIVWLLAQLPTLLGSPQVVVIWENAAELAVLVSGAWVLAARRARGARILFGLALVAFGIAHFAYIDHTASLVPTWLPFHTGWAYLTGVAHIAAGAGVLLSIVPRLAATLEASMLSLFTLIIWIPAVAAAPTSMPLWTEILMSVGIIAGSWVIAESIPARIHTADSQYRFSLTD